MKKLLFLSVLSLIPCAIKTMEQPKAYSLELLTGINARAIQFVFYDHHPKAAQILAARLLNTPESNAWLQDSKPNISDLETANYYQNQLLLRNDPRYNLTKADYEQSEQLLQNNYLAARTFFEKVASQDINKSIQAKAKLALARLHQGRLGAPFNQELMENMRFKQQHNLIMKKFACKQNILSASLCGIIRRNLQISGP